MAMATMEITEIQEEEKTETLETEENFDLNEEEEEVFFQDIQLLTEHGISPEDIEKMRNIGLNTIKGIQMTIRSKLQEIDGFDRKKIDKIQEACTKIALNDGFMTALEISEERKQIFKLSTGSRNLDKLLGGGIESMSVSEVFGEARTGKTQLAHTLCVTAQIPTGAYSGGKVMFIDTEHTFRPKRICSIAKRFELDEKGVLENILCARAYNSEHQFQLLNKVREKFHEEAGVFKLLIVDSIMALFRVDFSGNGRLIQRQQKLGQMMSTLQKISEEYNVAVFLTNQITADFKFALLELDVPKPVGGNILAHASTTRIALKKLPGNVRIAMLYDSPDVEEGEEIFAITNGGVSDPKIEINNASA